MAHNNPLELHHEVIRPEWIDYNGHMNLAWYVLVFDHATDAFLDHIGMTGSFREQHNGSTFSAEIHVNYLREVMAGDPVRVTTQLLDFDNRKIHYFHRMYHAERGYLAATNELISLYMDMNRRRVGAMPPLILERLRRIRQQHEQLAAPEQQGSVIGIRH